MSQLSSSTSSFKLFLLKLVLPVILLVAGGGYLFSIYFEKKIILGSDICGAYKVNRIINKTYPYEIPILGSSRAEEDYIPDILGTNYFNYGLNGTGPNVMLFFLKEECKKKKKSPLILLNFDLSGFIRPLGDISNYIYNARYQPVRELLGKNYETHYSIPFIKYYGFYEAYLKYYFNNKMNLTIYSNKGAIIQKWKVPGAEFNDVISKRKQRIEGFAIDTAMENTYFRLINENPQRFFIVVIAPYHKSFFKGYQHMQEAKAFLDSLQSKKNVRIFDFSKETYADSLFIDNKHLNYDGAVRFSRELKDSLAKHSFNNF